MDRFWEILCYIICQLLKYYSLLGFLHDFTWPGFCGINVKMLVEDKTSTYFFQKKKLIWEVNIVLNILAFVGYIICCNYSTVPL